MQWFFQVAFISIFSTIAAADPLPTAFKPAPTRPSSEANVIVVDQEVLETCDTEQICVQGLLHNNGAKPAYQVNLRVEIGGIKQSKPKLVIVQKVENPLMQPGDQQEFYFAIDRKIPTKNSKGEDKIIEVGRYNFRLVPTWNAVKPKPAKKPAAKPSTKKKSY